MNTPCRTTGLLGFGLLLMGCTTTPASLPFHPRASDDPAAFGYSDSKIDASHYSVAYADPDAKSADAFLELRAAQIAQGAGLHYFAFDKRGNSALQHTQNSLQMPDDRLRAKGGGGSPLATDWVPDIAPARSTTYYLAWGQVALLTDSQGQNNPKALGVNEVLARPAAP